MSIAQSLCQLRDEEQATSLPQPNPVTLDTLESASLMYEGPVSQPPHRIEAARGKRHPFDQQDPGGRGHGRRVQESELGNSRRNAYDAWDISQPQDERV